VAGVGLGQGQQLGTEAQARQVRVIGIDFEADLVGDGLEIDQRSLVLGRATLTGFLGTRIRPASA